MLWFTGSWAKQLSIAKHALHSLLAVINVLWPSEGYCSGTTIWEHCSILKKKILSKWLKMEIGLWVLIFARCWYINRIMYKKKNDTQNVLFSLLLAESGVVVFNFSESAKLVVYKKPKILIIILRCEDPGVKFLLIHSVKQLRTCSIFPKDLAVLKSYFPDLQIVGFLVLVIRVLKSPLLE